jgi:hypothetical protein
MEQLRQLGDVRRDLSRRNLAEKASVCYDSPANMEVVRDRLCSEEGNMAVTRILLLGTLFTLIGTAFPVLAATKHHHRVTQVHSPISNLAPDIGCPANGGPSCSSACTGSGPCAPPDRW